MPGRPHHCPREIFAKKEFLRYVYILFIKIIGSMAEIQHSIKIASRRTGLSPHVIRIWEKRYGAVVPARTKTNRRLYDEAEIERLTLLGLATKAGHTIKNAVKLTTADLRALVKSEIGQSADQTNDHKAQVADEGLASDLFNQALVAIKALDDAGFEKILNRTAVELGRSALLQQTLAPLIEEIGCSWRSGQMRAVHEHLATVVIRTFLGNFSHGYALGENAPRIVVTTPVGQLHELGALLVAATADNHGWRVSYLGPSLPSEEIAGAVILSGARAVALSIVYPEDDGSLDPELRKLRLMLPREVALITGGRAAPAYASVLTQIGAIQLQDLSALCAILDSLVRKRRQKVT
jgi:MerR family transcriptional regulator, light-induced transcriptional regulator